LERLEGSDYAPGNLPPAWAKEARVRFERVTSGPGLEDSKPRVREELRRAGPLERKPDRVPEQAQEPVNAFFPGLVVLLVSLVACYLVMVALVVSVRACRIAWEAQAPWGKLTALVVELGRGW
tara:strand:+ start:129 stop:497 length:369 start_codon:yes stop_codon:yes gene_type:complete